MVDDSQRERRPGPLSRMMRQLRPGQPRDVAPFATQIPRSPADNRGRKEAPEGRPDGSGTKAGGRPFTPSQPPSPQSGLRRLHYVSSSGTILTPEEAKSRYGEAHLSLTVIDPNGANVGYASPDGAIYTPKAMEGMSPEIHALFKPMDLGPDDTKYISGNGSIYTAKEINESHPDLRGGVRKLDGLVARRGWVSETDGTLYRSMWQLRCGQTVRDVDLRRVESAYVTPAGQIISREEARRTRPVYRMQYTEVDLSRVPLGYVSRERVVFPEPGPGRTAVDVRRLPPGYSSAQELHRNAPGQQQHVATAANVGSCSTLPPKADPVHRSAVPPSPPRTAVAASAPPFSPGR